DQAIALMVREALTGARPPRSAERTVELWRNWVQDKAGGNIEALEASLQDQGAFARIVRDMLVSMDMAEELGDDEEDPSEENDDDQPENREPSEEEGEAD